MTYSRIDIESDKLNVEDKGYEDYFHESPPKN